MNRKFYTRGRKKYTTPEGERDFSAYDKEVTIYTDANPWAGAFWARSSKGRYKESFFLPMDSNDFKNFEYTTILIALAFVLNKWKDMESVLIVTDSQAAIHRLKKLSFPISIRTKWIKGHLSHDTPQAYINNWCDKEADRLKQIRHRKGTGYGCSRV